MDRGAPLGRPEAWPAPGKLNLFLHVVGRRDDGYHLLQTAFQFIDLADEIRFFRRPAGVIERLGDVPGVAPEADLTRAGGTAAGLTGVGRIARSGDRGHQAAADAGWSGRRELGCRNRPGCFERAVGHGVERR